MELVLIKFSVLVGDQGGTCMIFVITATFQLHFKVFLTGIALELDEF